MIEDERSICESICDVLELEGYQTLAAANGKIGVELARKHLPDLILCDVSMPEMNGYEVLSLLQQTQQTRLIPFIFLTARTTQADQRRGMNLGADDYLAKPCSAGELLKAITSRFEKQTLLKTQTEAQLKRLRDSITQSLPHELYTPLNGILGCSEFLSHESETLDRLEVQEIGKLIYTSALRLHHLMQNFLLYTKLELTAHHPEQQQLLQSHITIEPNWVIQNVAQQVATQANRMADLQLQLASPVQALVNRSSENPPFAIKVAESYLHKAVRELVDNAFKFSEPGTSVQVATELQPERLLLLVTNWGRGMTAEQIADLGAYMQFERKFYEQQGSGLGLIIVKRIVELYGGRFSISSIPDVSIAVQVSFCLASSDGG